MGLRDWLAKLRKSEDDAAIRRAQERASGESLADQEIYTGDIQGRAADERAAQRYEQGGSGRIDPFR
jgi:hypothetical protein